MATTSLRNWDFQKFHVETDIPGGDLINAATILIAAGPPKLRFLGGRFNPFLRAAAGIGTAIGRPEVTAAFNAIQGITAAADAEAESFVDIDDFAPIAYPIGVIEAVNVSQARQIQRLFEIGSKRSYFIPGRNVGQLSITRTLFNGPSLMRALYAYYPGKLINQTVKNLLSVANNKVDSLSTPIRNQPGFGNMFSNLDSELFDQPFGLLIYIKDTSNDPYSAIFLENAYINTHQMSISATSTLLAEGVTVQFDQAIPIDVQSEVRIGPGIFDAAINAVGGIVDQVL